MWRVNENNAQARSSNGPSLLIKVAPMEAFMQHFLCNGTTQDVRDKEEFQLGRFRSVSLYVNISKSKCNHTIPSQDVFTLLFS